MVVIPPGSTAEKSPDVGFSFPKMYTAMGFCADVSRMGSGAQIKIRVALHSTKNVWDVKDVVLTTSKPKVVLSFPANYDGCSFRRQDDVAIDIIPNFK